MKLCENHKFVTSVCTEVNKLLCLKLLYRVKTGIQDFVKLLHERELHEQDPMIEANRFTNIYTENKTRFKMLQIVIKRVKKNTKLL